MSLGDYCKCTGVSIRKVVFLDRQLAILCRCVIYRRQGGDEFWVGDHVKSLREGNRYIVIVWLGCLSWLKPEGFFYLAIHGYVKPPLRALDITTKTIFGWWGLHPSPYPSHWGLRPQATNFVRIESVMPAPPNEKSYISLQS